MTQGALDPDRLQSAVPFPLGGDTDHRVGVEKGQRHRWIIQVDASLTDRGQRCARQRLGIDLQADTERRGGGESGSDATEPRAFDRLVKPQRAAPEPLVAEGIESKDVTSPLQEVGRVARDPIVERVRSLMAVHFPRVLL